MTCKCGHVFMVHLSDIRKPQKFRTNSCHPLVLIKALFDWGGSYDFWKLEYFIVFSVQWSLISKDQGKYYSFWYEAFKVMQMFNLSLHHTGLSLFFCFSQFPLWFGRHSQWKILCLKRFLVIFYVSVPLSVRSDVVASAPPEGTIPNHYWSY